MGELSKPSFSLCVRDTESDPRYLGHGVGWVWLSRYYSYMHVLAEETLSYYLNLTYSTENTQKPNIPLHICSSHIFNRLPICFTQTHFAAY